MNDIELKRALGEWAKAYGGMQFRRLGYAGNGALKAVDEEIAEVEPGSVAEQIEHIVRLMEECGRWRESRVLRAEYFMAGLAECERLERLKRIGMQMSRPTYYRYLDAAKAFVLGSLSRASLGGALNEENTNAQA